MSHSKHSFPYVVESFNKVLFEVLNRKLTYLSKERLAVLMRAVMSIERCSIPGTIIEAGCALGGSSCVIANTKLKDRKLFIYDIFGMIPQPTSDDPPEVHKRYEIIKSGRSGGLGSNQYYGYIENLKDVVIDNLRIFEIDICSNNIELIPGLVQQTIVDDFPVALAHIDLDWYEPVKHTLFQIFPRLSRGGMIIIDDYYDWGGCTKAVEEFLLCYNGEYLLENHAASLKIIKI